MADIKARDIKVGRDMQIADRKGTAHQSTKDADHGGMINAAQRPKDGLSAISQAIQGFVAMIRKVIARR